MPSPLYTLVMTFLITLIFGLSIGENGVGVLVSDVLACTFVPSSDRSLTTVLLTVIPVVLAVFKNGPVLLLGINVTIKVK